MRTPAPGDLRLLATATAAGHSAPSDPVLEAPAGRSAPAALN